MCSAHCCPEPISPPPHPLVFGGTKEKSWTVVLGATAQTHQQRALSQMKFFGGAPMGERKFGGHNDCPGFSTGKEDPCLDPGRSVHEEQGLPSISLTLFGSWCPWDEGLHLSLTSSPDPSFNSDASLASPGAQQERKELAGR